MWPRGLGLFPEQFWAMKNFLIIIKVLAVLEILIKKFLLPLVHVKFKYEPNGAIF